MSGAALARRGRRKLTPASPLQVEVVGASAHASDFVRPPTPLLSILPLRSSARATRAPSIERVRETRFSPFLLIGVGPICARRGVALTRARAPTSTGLAIGAPLLRPMLIPRGSRWGVDNWSFGMPRVVRGLALNKGGSKVGRLFSKYVFERMKKVTTF